MKKFIQHFVLYFIIIFQFISVYTYAQSNNYKVIYRHCLEMDTTRVLSDTMGREAVLIGNNNVSSYVFAKLPKELWAAALPATTSIDKILQEKKSGTSNYTIGTGKRFDTIGNILYFDKLKDSILVREKMINDYIVTIETTPKINWNISEESKTIKNYTCLKATCEFRGRSYVAWYTNEIPISDGPWKFKGLPGLILEMEDDKHQVKLYATHIEFPTSGTVANFVENGIPITLKQYMGYRNEEMHQQMRGMEVSLQSQEHSNKVNLNSRATTKIGMYGIEKKLD